MSALREIRLGGRPDPWVALGLAVGPDPATLCIGAVACRFDVDSPVGIRSLGVEGLDEPRDVDGIRFTPAAPVPPGPSHPCGATSIDHVVVMTSSLERTCAAVEASVGAPLRRIRDAGPGVRQGFHRLGEVILEVVESPQVTADEAQLWGLVVTVPDLDGWAAGFGPDLLSPPKPAVQRGRRIANLRAGAGLGMPVAFMSPDPPRPADA